VCPLVPIFFGAHMDWSIRSRVAGPSNWSGQCPSLGEVQSEVPTWPTCAVAGRGPHRFCPVTLGTLRHMGMFTPGDPGGSKVERNLSHQKGHLTGSTFGTCLQLSSSML
jgi:hypothetical protein